MRGWLYSVLTALALIGLCWLLIPFFLGFSPSQAIQWGSLSDAPEILAEWQAEKNHAGKIIMTDKNGGQTVITTRNGEVIRIEKTETPEK